MLAHGTILSDEFLGPDAVQAIAADSGSTGLDAVDVAKLDPQLQAALTVGRPIAGG
jgi:hypothetical protein